MGKKFDLLVFDWDGTLSDSTAVIVQSLQTSCRELGLPEPSDEEANHVIGLELSKALKHMLPDFPEERLPTLIERYRYNYLTHDSDIRLFNGIEDLLNNLHENGFHLAVATGKNRRGLNRAFSNLNMKRFFTASRCGDECFSKPHPQMLEELMDEFDVPRERALMVGDTSHDMQMAVNAGTAGLAVSYGAHPADELHRLNPLACLSSVEELSQWLLRNA